MEVIRTIRTVKNGQVLLDLPSELSGREVEIIVLTKDIAFLRFMRYTLRFPVPRSLK